MIRRYDFVSGVTSAAAPTGATEFSLANNTANQTITGAVFDKTVYRSFTIRYQIIRGTRAEAGVLIGVTDGTNWEIAHGYSVSCPDTDDAGCDFTITSGGQLQVTTDSGTTGTLDWTLVDQLAV